MAAKLKDVDDLESLGPKQPVEKARKTTAESDSSTVMLRTLCTIVFLILLLYPPLSSLLFRLLG